jgi:hypothetical protein
LTKTQLNFLKTSTISNSNKSQPPYLRFEVTQYYLSRQFFNKRNKSFDFHQLEWNIKLFIIIATIKPLVCWWYLGTQCKLSMMKCGIRDLLTGLRVKSLSFYRIFLGKINHKIGLEADESLKKPHTEDWKLMLRGLCVSGSRRACR